MKSHFLQKVAKVAFSKKSNFDWENHVKVKKLMKPKMVRMVHRNILYDVDLEIRDSKSELGRKSKK